MTAPLCLITRPEVQSHAFAAGLADIETLISPVLRIVPLDFDPAIVRDAPGLVFTSANALPFAGPAQGRMAICVGPQTASAALEAGFTVTEGSGDADSLLPLLEARTSWLHIHGRHRSRVLPCHSLAVYDQIAQPLSDAARAAILGEKPLILPLFSPRSAFLLSKYISDTTTTITTVAISAQADAAYEGPVYKRYISPVPNGASMSRMILMLAMTERSCSPWVEAERGGR